MFDPENYKGQKATLTFQRYRFDDEKLYEYAQLATSLRKRFKETAEQIAKEDANGDEPVENILNGQIPKLYRGQTSAQLPTISSTLLHGCEHNMAFAKRKKRRLNQLSTEERVCIAKLAAAKDQTQREIAERHNVSVGLVSRQLYNLKHK